MDVLLRNLNHHPLLRLAVKDLRLPGFVDRTDAAQNSSVRGSSKSVALLCLSILMAEMILVLFGGTVCIRISRLAIPSTRVKLRRMLFDCDHREELFGSIGQLVVINYEPTVLPPS